MNVKHVTAEGREVSALVTEATVRDGLRRADIMRLEVQAMRTAEEGEARFMVIENLLRLNAYPSCIAATAEFSDSKRKDLDVGSMTFEDFLDVPEQFLTKWTEKVFELNPAWKEDAVGPWARPPIKTERSKSS